MFKRLLMVFFAVFLISGLALAEPVTVFWAEYDGDTADYTTKLEQAFKKENPKIDLQIIRVNWNNLHDRLLTFIAGKKEPDLSVIGTRWLLELNDLNVLEPIDKYLSKSLMNNIDPAAIEGKIGNTLYGLPMAYGTRIMYYRPDLVGDVPKTFEELREKALKANNPPNLYGVGMIGRKYVENVEFAYYLFANGGYYFKMNPDGTYGKCDINSPAGVAALTFMNNMVNKDKITQPGVGAYGRDEVQDLFLAGKLAFFLGGGMTYSLLEKNKPNFKWAVAPIPAFKGQKPSSLLVTDSIVMFKRSKNKEAAAKFLEFFYRDEWRLGFDKNTGFPPVTKSLATNPAFQSPSHKTMVASINGAKGWPLIAEWPQSNDIIWEAIEAVFQGHMQPKEALDKAAQKVDALRKK
ncbi:MAG: sugar ABC transporter substrate-binding protein [Desulfobacteraceae bacterium]|nr:MAG: sugar ABC transporter substrate-binding protein [Desulfobacteraceae bacterium]